MQKDEDISFKLQIIEIVEKPKKPMDATWRKLKGRQPPKIENPGRHRA